jgi:hypothetical protein
VPSEASAPFEQLDFHYMPSRDVAADLAYLTEVLGGRAIFAIEAMGACVAAVELAPHAPLVLLADHLDGERPILVYRVADLPAALADLEQCGWQREQTFEIPTARAARLRLPAATASRYTSAPARRPPPTSPAAATSSIGRRIGRFCDTLTPRLQAQTTRPELASAINVAQPVGSQSWATVRP